MSEHSPPLFDAADAEVARYHSLSSLAVAGLLAGVLSPLAMFAFVLWLLPLAAVVLSVLALRRIAARQPDLVGRPAAWAGLLLGATFLVAAPVEDMVYRSFLRQQARQFAGIWIDTVRQGDVYKAHHLTLDPKRRLPLENNLADYYAHNETQRRMLNQFVKEPTMRTLFALGPAAEVRFYETAAEGRRESLDFVEQTYAVTYPDEGEPPKTETAKKTFFITLLMQRSVDTRRGQAGWNLVKIDGGVRPSGW